MDIVERLRKHFRPWADDRDDQRLYTEAADEIERLREALKETLAVAKRNEIGDYIQRAETALQQKDSE